MRIDDDEMFMCSKISKDDKKFTGKFSNQFYNV